METDGRDTHRAGSSGVDNVVPFPRDWIGPLDDLVPVGPAADDPVEAEEVALGEALAADSFWSESSASLHQAVEAPAPSLDEVHMAHADVRRGVERRRRVPRVLGRRGRPPGLARPRLAALGMAAVVLLAGAAVAVETQSQAPSSGGRLALAGGPQERSGPAGGEATELARLSRLLVARAIERTSRRSGETRHVATRHHAGARNSGAASSAGAGTHVSVSYDVSPPTTPATSAGTPTSSSDGSVESGQTNAAASSSGGSSSGGAGPVGAGAPFGPGQLTGG